jgi:exopolysaccharide biosynthesis WecB/TagA/CpsF family protein
VCVGAGALFDFLSGEISRAPGWVRSLRLEWAYRLLLEPGRLWRRYLIGNATFLWHAWRNL